MGRNYRSSPIRHLVTTQRHTVTPSCCRWLPVSRCFLFGLLLVAAAASPATTDTSPDAAQRPGRRALHTVTRLSGSAQQSPSVPAKPGQRGQIWMLTAVSGCSDDSFSCRAPVTVALPSRVVSCLRIPQRAATQSFKIDWVGDASAAAAPAGAASAAAAEAASNGTGTSTTPGNSATATSRGGAPQAGRPSIVRAFICRSLIFWVSVNCSPLEPSFAVSIPSRDYLISAIGSTSQCSSNASASDSGLSRGSAGEWGTKPTSKLAVDSRGSTSTAADLAPQQAAGFTGAKLRGGAAIAGGGAIATIRFGGGAIGAPFRAPQQMGIRSISCEAAEPLDATTLALLLSPPAPCAPPSSASAAPSSGSPAGVIPRNTTGISATSSSSIPPTTYSSSQPVPANATAAPDSGSSDSVTLFALAVAAVLASVFVLGFVGAAFYFAPESAMRTAAAAAAAGTAAASIAADIAASAARHGRAHRNSRDSPHSGSTSSPSAPLRSSRSPSSSSSASSLPSLAASSSSSSSSADSRSSRSPSPGGNRGVAGSGGREGGNRSGGSRSGRARREERGRGSGRRREGGQGEENQGEGERRRHRHRDRQRQTEGDRGVERGEEEGKDGRMEGRREKEGSRRERGGPGKRCSGCGKKEGVGAWREKRRIERVDDTVADVLVMSGVQGVGEDVVERNRSSDGVQDGGREGREADGLDVLVTSVRVQEQGSAGEETRREDGGGTRGESSRDGDTLV